jgi:hypothetical protein
MRPFTPEVLFKAADFRVRRRFGLSAVNLGFEGL